MATARHGTMNPGTAPAFVGIDLAKNPIHVHAVDGAGRPCIDRKLKPARLKAFLAHLKPCVVGLEACGRSHPWGRDVLAMGHQAKLMAPQFVKPHVKSGKSDRADAEAICEAVRRPALRPAMLRPDPAGMTPDRGVPPGGGDALVQIVESGDQMYSRGAKLYIVHADPAPCPSPDVITTSSATGQPDGNPFSAPLSGDWDITSPMVNSVRQCFRIPHP